jgi:hypothetical protein
LYKHIRGWISSAQARPRATLVDLVNIEESEEKKAMEQQFVEAQAMQKEDVIEAGVQPSMEVQMFTKV